MSERKPYIEELQPMLKAAAEQDYEGAFFKLADVLNQILHDPTKSDDYTQGWNDALLMARNVGKNGVLKNRIDALRKEVRRET